MAILGAKAQLEVFRGDSLRLLFTVKNQNQELVTLTGANIRFTLKRKLTDDQVLIMKSTDDPLQVSIETPTSALIRIEGTDTEGLPCGRYVFDVRVTLADGSRGTPIVPSPFIVSDAVGTH